ncbi:MAG TPA: peptidylprolyl isomerase [Gemmatimonadaceae bacterium]
MKRPSLLVLLVGATSLVACDGLKEALTAHVDVVARAASQELSVTRLSDLLGKAKIQIPINKDVATLVARDLWVPYQLLGAAAAKGDSLNDPKAIDAAASGMIEQAKLQKFMESVASSMPSDTGSQASYESGANGLYAARHILFLVPKGATPAAKDSIRRKAESVRTQVTAANFAELAKKYSDDNSKERGGELGVFPRSMMVKPFGDAVAALKPGQISPLVESEFGFHIIQRNTWDEIKGQYAQQAGDRTRQAAESIYIAKAQADAQVKVKDNAASVTKTIAKDPISHRHDSDVIATWKGGNFTAGQLASVIFSDPRGAQLSQQIQTLPDSIIRKYVEQMTQRELLLQRADSAKMGPTPEQMASLHRDFVQAVTVAWQSLRIDPKSLADSAKTESERERLAASRVEAFLDKVMAGEAQPLPVPAPLQIVLMDKYEYKLNTAGVDRAVERAQKIRVVADSTRAANQPKSAVPLPGTPGAAPGQAAPPAGAAPAPTPPAGKQAPAQPAKP